MSPFIATGGVLECPDLHVLESKATQLEKTALSDNAPWMYSALSQVRDLESSGTVVRGVGDFRIAERAASRARLLLSLIDLVDLPAPTVCPVSGGGLSILWAMGGREVKFSCYPDGQTLFFQSTDEEIIADGLVNLGDASTARVPLSWMAKPEAR